MRRKDAPASWAVRHRKLDAPYGYRLDRKASWTDPEMIRFIGFQGKRSIEALFDPASIPSYLPGMCLAGASAKSSGRFFVME